MVIVIVIVVDSDGDRGDIAGDGENCDHDGDRGDDSI